MTTTARLRIDRIVDPGGRRIVGRTFSEARVRRSVSRILESNVLCSISTVTKGNQAHINTAYFCYSGNLDVYFLSDPHSFHGRNLSTNASAAMAIFDPSQTWGRPDRGIQLYGTCKEARGRTATKAGRLYGERFSVYQKWMAGRNEEEKRLAAQLRTYRFYRFVARKVKILDEREFGGGVFVIAFVRRARESK